MLFTYHILLSLPFILLCYKNIFFILSFLSSVLIDIDHYLYFIINYNSTSLNKYYKWARERKPCFRIFHSPYFLAILIIFLSILITLKKQTLSKVLLFIIIGLTYHIIIDIIYTLITKNNWKEILFIKLIDYNSFKIKRG